MLFALFKVVLFSNITSVYGAHSNQSEIGSDGYLIRPKYIGCYKDKEK